MRLLILLFLFLPIKLFGCSCAWADSFCTYAESYFSWTEGKTAIARVRFLEFRTPDVNGYAPLYDFKILEVLAGELADPVVTLWGQDGGNCNGPILSLRENGEYIIMFATREGYTSYYPEISGGINNPYPIFDYPGCGPATLEVTGGQIRGEIQPGVSSIARQRLRNVLEDCLGDFIELAPDPFPIPRYEAQLFPNPASERVTLQFAQPAPVFSVRLYDMLGRLISADRLGGAVVTRHEINVSQLPAGVYQVVAETDGIRVKKQVVVL